MSPHPLADEIRPAWAPRDSCQCLEFARFEGLHWTQNETPKTRIADGESPSAARDSATGGPTQAAYCVAHALSDLLTRGCADNAAATRSCYTQRAGHLLRILGESPWLPSNQTTSRPSSTSGLSKAQRARPSAKRSASHVAHSTGAQAPHPGQSARGPASSIQDALCPEEGMALA